MDSRCFAKESCVDGVVRFTVDDDVPYVFRQKSLKQVLNIDFGYFGQAFRMR